MATSFERVIVVVLDGIGAGELPDAADYGDLGSDTLANTAAAVGGINLPNLERLGLGNLGCIAGVKPKMESGTAFGRLRERSPGKDSVTGHWEMMGVILEKPFPTYPRGFPSEIIEPFEKLIGRRILGNVAASGTEIISRLGDEHVRTGSSIVYTSADSVFQIAAHESVVPPAQLYEMCIVARRILMGEHAVGRVIARPFTGESPHFRRTEGRRDYPLDPPWNVLDQLHDAGRSVHAIGKISEFFAGRGITSAELTTNNRSHMDALTNQVEVGCSEFVFANLEDFDMLYGHRNDPAGMARALAEFDAELGRLRCILRPTDLLILTSDHGNDPTTPSTDHSREHALLLANSKQLQGSTNLGDRESFADIGATVLDALRVDSVGLAGTSILRGIYGAGSR